MSVEQLFSMVDGALEAVASGSLPHSEEDDFQLFYDFEVRLDPTLGYPTQFAQYSRATRLPPEIIWRDSVEPVIKVTNLKVLR
jgi:hypothetical protein